MRAQQSEKRGTISIGRSVTARKFVFGFSVEGFVASFSDAWSSVAEIDGWLTEGQARMLYNAAAQVPDAQAIVEIGSHHGRSTVILGNGKSDAVRLVAVDPYGDPRWGGGEDAMEVFRSNLAARDLSDVELIRSLGAEAGKAWEGANIGLLFVDGAHDYPSVSADLTAWWPHLSPSAIVLMHDVYSSPGVTRAAFEHMFGSNFRFAGSSRSLVRFERGTARSHMRSRIAMLSKLPWLARYPAVKAARRQGWTGVEKMLGHRDAALPY